MIKIVYVCLYMFLEPSQNSSSVSERGETASLISLTVQGNKQVIVCLTAFIVHTYLHFYL